jgi:hypothetical protein
MALTNNTYPANIDSSAAFNVTTSLIEDSTHVNLRIRAEIYTDGVVRAAVEKPKGIPDFNFFDIMKSLTPGLSFARDSGKLTETGSRGANLITSWAGTYTTFTYSTNSIVSAISASAAFANSNVIALTAGKIYCIHAMNYISTGATTPIFKLCDAITGITCPEIIQTQFSYIENNKSWLIMCISSGNVSLHIRSDAGAADFSGEFYMNEITSTIGSPLVPYVVTFTEYWETAAGVTTSGDVITGPVYRFVPAAGDGTAFYNYVLLYSVRMFASKTLRNGIIKYFTYKPSEYWISFFTEFVELELFYSKDGATYVHNEHPICSEGWGIIILNVGELMNTVVTSLQLYMKEINDAITISETLTVLPDTSQLEERVVLEYDGLLGGKEYLPFEGLTSIEYSTVRNYYLTSGKVRKPLSFLGINRQKIETRFKDMPNTDYLKGLLVSDNVKKLEPSYAEPTEVTIITDNVKINGGTELFTNRLELEY